jgi:hypothetical protein
VLELRLVRAELTYETFLMPSVAAVIDTPGQVASVLMSEFDTLDVALSDLVLDDGPLQDTGLTCEIDKLNASVVLRADRFQVHFLEIDGSRRVAEEIVPRLWKAVASVSPEVQAKSHSLLFEMDCALAAGSYAGALEQFCRPHERLPKGTETAIVYYLPRDSSQGFLDSSMVLNRSAEVEGGVLLIVTFVFDGRAVAPEAVIEAGQKRLNELLRNLEIHLDHPEAG